MILLGSLPIYGTLIGVIQGNFFEKIYFDLQPYIYMIMLLYVCVNRSDVKEYAISTFIKTSKIYAVLASVSYITYVIMLHSNFLNFNFVYGLLSSTGEFFFRPGGAFFAKSFFFIGIGAIAFFCERKIGYFLLCIFAIFLTETRGVFLFTCVAAMFASLRINSMLKNITLISITVFLVQH